MDIRTGSLVRTTHLGVVVANQQRDLRVGIVQIAGNDRIGRAHHGARRLQILFHTVRTEMTFFNRTLVFIQVDRVIRTRLHAGTTADACITVDVHDAIVSFFQRVDRADGHAWRVGAVIAPLNEKVPLDLGIGSRFDVLH